ncbi:hypothetical protein EV641_12637 [Rhodococcus sp. SMB37]|nr:hypothetical protein EV641_12637 [Rhodococcus sp. SMB37]
MLPKTETTRDLEIVDEALTGIDAYHTRVPGTHFDAGLGAVLAAAATRSRAPRNWRDSPLNVAATHHERVSAAGRLVYGGHTIGIALGRATRALPNLVAVDVVDHTGPVPEGDTLTSELHVEGVDDLGGGEVLHLHSLVFSHTATATDIPVLDRRFSALTA